MKQAKGHPEFPPTLMEQTPDCANCSNPLTAWEEYQESFIS